MAAPTERFGSAAFQSARYCRDGVNGTGNILAADINCMGPSNPDLQRKDTRIPGGEGTTIDSVSNMTTGGTVVSKVSLGELGLPVIKSGAWSDDDTRIGSSVVTYMGFTFTGAAATPYALDALIDWTASASPLYMADVANGLQGGEYAGEAIGGFHLVLMSAASVPVFADANAITSFNFYEGCGFAGVLGAARLDMARATGGYHEASLTLDTGCDGNPLMVQPGESYILFSFKQTIGNRGGFMDATNTIRVQLADSLPQEVQDTLRANIVSARSLVPEPASWAMLIAGFGLVGAVARRQTARRAAC